MNIHLVPTMDCLIEVFTMALAGDLSKVTIDLVTREIKFEGYTFTPRDARTLCEREDDLDLPIQANDKEDNENCAWMADACDDLIDSIRCLRDHGHMDT